MHGRRGFSIVIAHGASNTNLFKHIRIMCTLCNMNVQTNLTCRDEVEFVARKTAAHSWYTFELVYALPTPILFPSSLSETPCCWHALLRLSFENVQLELLPFWSLTNIYIVYIHPPPPERRKQVEGDRKKISYLCPQSTAVTPFYTYYYGVPQLMEPMVYIKTYMFRYFY